MKYNKFFRGVAILLFAVLLGGCSLENGIDTLLKPPQLSETRQMILDALRGSVGAYDLHSPISGQYHTAIITTDMTGDGENEAVCFFTAEKLGAGVSMMVLKQSNGKWGNVGLYTSDAHGIDKVEFCDINGDGIKEAAIGWRYPTGNDNGLEIVALQEETPQVVYSGLYTQFEVLQEKDVVIISKVKTTESSTVTASLLGWREEKATVVSSVPMESAVLEYLAVQVGTTTKGDAALFVDTRLENANYTTEVLVINKEGFLENRLFSLRKESKTTLQRALSVVCTDINKDGVLDIPMTEPLQMRKADAKQMYLTRWYSFDGEKLAEITASYTSPTNQFCFVLPEEWVGKITVEQDQNNERMYRFLLAQSGTPLFELRIFTTAEFNNNAAANGWSQIAAGTDKLAAYHAYTGYNVSEKYRLTAEEMGERFIFIS